MKRGQVSVELIIVIAALVAVALVLVTQLQKTATTASAKVSNKTADVMAGIDDIGMSCDSANGDDDCPANYECSDRNVCVKTT